MIFNKPKVFASLSMEQAERILQNDKSIILLDVRTYPEYQQGHIPGSINFPLEKIMQIRQELPDQSKRLFVYCHSGVRSRYVCAELVAQGYQDVTDIGGIIHWNGTMKKEEMA